MGSVQKDPSVFHFSHPHPLECTTAPSTGIVRCFGCKLRVTCGEDYYRCKTCAFSLHYVCYKMPLITNHPSHPRHELVLLVVPSSPATKATLNCMACKHHVMGLCYHCAECNIFFHALCLALPLSLTITHHPHKIKLEFSPPYDFFCDLCNKPSYKGWLYRCSMCEFDIHIACAVENLEPKLFQNSSFSQSNALLRQLTSHQVEHTRLSGSGGDNSSSIGCDYNKIMRLVAQQIGGGINRSQEDFDSALTGWDKKLQSPRKKHNKSIGKVKIVELELQEKEPSSTDFLANLEERAPLRDQSTPLSDHTSAQSSNQFSDSCFSIDLAKSYSTHERRSQARKEVSSDQITGSFMPERIVSNSKQAEEPFRLVKWPSNDSYNTLNAAFSKEGRTSDFGESNQKDVMKNRNQSLANWSTKDQRITKSESLKDKKRVSRIFSAVQSGIFPYICNHLVTITAIYLSGSWEQPTGKRQPFRLEEVPNLLPLAQACGRCTVFEAQNVEVVDKMVCKLISREQKDIVDCKTHKSLTIHVKCMKTNRLINEYYSVNYQYYDV